MVANLYLLQNTEGNKSFLWHKQLNYDITALSFTDMGEHLLPAISINENKSLIAINIINYNQ